MNNTNTNKQDKRRELTNKILMLQVLIEDKKDFVIRYKRDFNVSYSNSTVVKWNKDIVELEIELTALNNELGDINGVR